LFGDHKNICYTILGVVGLKKIDINNWNRKKIFNWFKSFSNSCWSMTKELDVTNLVKYTKESKTSFFINMLYVVVKTLNSLESMRMRLIGDEPVIYDNINPAYTVMTESGIFENLRHDFIEEYNQFYLLAKEKIKVVKKQLKSNDIYNLENQYNEYYITCVPWVEFSNINHPIPDDKSSQSVPRICWGKYFERNDKYIINFNITVSHMFCDGYDVAQFFLKLQENLDSTRIICIN